jgi:hypothetical protein
VETSEPGVTMEIRTGPSDPGDSEVGDGKVMQTFKPVGEEGAVTTDGTKQIFSGIFDPNTKYQHILVFLTKLPPAQDGGDGFQVAVTKIEVFGN